MGRRWFIAIPLAAAIITVAAVLAVLARQEKHDVIETAKQKEVEKTIFPAIPEFYDRYFFEIAVASATGTAEQDIRAVIIPHHLLAAELMASTLHRASGREVDTVIVVGPNHASIGPAPVVSVDGVWTSPVGEAISDSAKVADLLDALEAHSNPESFAREHSIGAVLPLVERYFPQAGIVPVILRPDAPQDAVERLAAWLAEQDPARTLIVFSIDFSHYLTEVEADERDRRTKTIIEEEDANAALRLGGEYFDSPPTLSAALRFARLEGLQARILAQGNSNDFSPLDTDLTTSYFAVAF